MENGNEQKAGYAALLEKVGKGPSLEQAINSSAAAAKEPSRIASILGKQVPVQQPATRARRREERRSIAEKALREGILRIKDVRRRSPRAWEHGYNSAVTQLEVLLNEILDRKWSPSEL